MKLLITANSPELEGPVNPRFGRADYFIVIDTETMNWEAHENKGVDAIAGAGSQAARFVTEQRVGAVISGDFGPNAYIILAAAEIKMYLLGPSRTVWEAIANFIAGKLSQVLEPAGVGRQQAERA